MSAQLDLFRHQSAWECPLYGCRRGCTCSPEKIAETKRRQAALSKAEAPASAIGNGASASESVKRGRDLPEGY